MATTLENAVNFVPTIEYVTELYKMLWRERPTLVNGTRLDNDGQSGSVYFTIPSDEASYFYCSPCWQFFCDGGKSTHAPSGIDIERVDDKDNHSLASLDFTLTGNLQHDFATFVSTLNAFVATL